MGGEEIQFLSKFRRATLGLMAFSLLLLLASFVSADQEWDDVELREVDSWKDPSGNGTDLQMDISHDMDRLLLVGYGGPDEIRVVDRDVKTIATLVPPGINPTVKGARWSQSGTWIVAWGRAEDNDSDFLSAWNGTTYEPADNLFENDTTPLVEIGSAVFMAFGDLLFISGRDVNGTSRVLLVETSSMTVHKDYPWENDATITYLVTDGLSILCIDETGVITSIGGTDWSEVVRFEDGSSHRPSSHAISSPSRNPWVIGYEDGSVYFWQGYPIFFSGDIDLGAGPVQGLAWTFTDPGSYYMVALPGEGQGSQLSVLYKEYDNTSVLPVSNTIDTGSPVTILMMDKDPPGNVWAAFADGSLGYYNATIILNLPPEVTIDVPLHQQLYTGKVRFEGSFSDDHDNTQWVKVRVDDDDFQDANLVGNLWWYEIDTDLIREGLHVFNIEVFDGRHQTGSAEIFNTPQEPYNNDEEGPPGIPQIPFLIVAIAVVVILLWRRAHRTDGEDHQDVPPST
jgi:hypothetical protein